MKRILTALTLSLLLSSGFASVMKARVEGVQVGEEEAYEPEGFVEYGQPGGEAYAPQEGVVSEPQARALDNDKESFWRIQNKSNQVLKIASDTDFLILPVGDDYRLDREASFSISVNGKKFTTNNHVIVFFSDGPALNMESSPTWNNALGFGFTRVGSGLGKGLSKGGFWGGHRLGWAHFRGGHKPHTCVGPSCMRGGKVGVRGGQRGAKMHGGGWRRGEGRHGKHGKHGERGMGKHGKR
jgi:hypothetical protein